MITGDCDKKDFALSYNFTNKSVRYLFLIHVWYYREIPQFNEIISVKKCNDAVRRTYFDLLEEARSEKWLKKSERELWEMAELEDAERIRERKRKAENRANHTA